MSEINSVTIDADFITRYLHEHIPITKAMKVKAEQADDHAVRLSAPFDPNVNHRGTVFGGSAGTLAILSAWSMLYRKLKLQEFNGGIVIQHSSFDYKNPIKNDFSAVCRNPSAKEWERFITTLRRWNKARIRLKSVITCDAKVTGKFEGEYVALAGETR